MDITAVSAIAWDLRACVEAQVRSLTALQRCIDDYKIAPSAGAKAGIHKHFDEVNARHVEISSGLASALDILRPQPAD